MTKAELKEYIAALKHNDAVKWQAARGGPFEGSFIRAATPPAKTIIVRMPDGRERYVPKEKLIRCCSRCGCTEDEACLGGCSWWNIKTCDVCIMTGHPNGSAA